MTVEQGAQLIQTLTPVALVLIPIVWGFIYKRLPKSKQEAVKHAADLVVPALQQGAETFSNADKKAAAVAKVQEILASFGYRNVPSALIDAAIEAAVFSMKQVPPVTTSGAQGTK